MKKRKKSDELLRKKGSKSFSKRKDKTYKDNLNPQPSPHRLKLANVLIKKRRTTFYKYFSERRLIKNNIAATKFIIPKHFSLVDRPKETQNLITEIAASYELNNTKNIVVDFSKCEKITYGAIFVLDCILTEIAKDKIKFEQKYQIPFRPRLHFLKSKVSEIVNSKIFSIGFLKYFNTDKKQDTPHSTTKTLCGSKSQTHPMDNKKSVVSLNVVNYIDQIINELGWELSFQSKSLFGKLIGEILNNAEDHSDYDRWFIRCTAFKKSDETTYEINIQFLNFGYSIYEELEKSIAENESIREIKNMAEKINNETGNKFNIEALMTLYSLQEGVSRLKNEDKSRGFGTITFISSFLGISNYKFQDQEGEMNILSGNTLLKITDKYRPFQIDGKYFISLNTEQNLMIPPDRDFLRTNSTYFPGTLISAKLFVNHDDFERKNSQ